MIKSPLRWCWLFQRRIIESLTLSELQYFHPPVFSLGISFIASAFFIILLPMTVLFITLKYSSISTIDLNLSTRIHPELFSECLWVLIVRNIMSNLFYIVCVVSLRVLHRGHHQGILPCSSQSVIVRWMKLFFFFFFQYRWKASLVIFMEISSVSFIF